MVESSAVRLGQSDPGHSAAMWRGQAINASASSRSPDESPIRRSPIDELPASARLRVRAHWWRKERRQSGRRGC